MQSGISRKQYMNIIDLSWSAYAECFGYVCKALSSPSLVNNHSDRLHVAVNTEIISKQLGPYLTFSRDERQQKRRHVTSAEGFVVSDVSASLHVQMCNTCWEEQKEFLLWLLSIPHETSLPEPALRLAPSLRHTARYWCLKFCSGHGKRGEKYIQSPRCPATLSYDSFTLLHNIIHLSHWSHMSGIFKYSSVLLRVRGRKEQSLMHRCKRFLGRENQIRVSLTCLAVCSPGNTWRCG